MQLGKLQRVSTHIGKDVSVAKKYIQEHQPKNLEDLTTAKEATWEPPDQTQNIMCNLDLTLFTLRYYYTTTNNTTFLGVHTEI